MPTWKDYAIGILLPVFAAAGFYLQKGAIPDKPSPEHERTESLEKKVSPKKHPKLKDIELQEDEKTAQPYILFKKNDKLPFDDKFYFENHAVKSYWQSDFYLALCKAKRELTGNGNITAHDLYQLLAKTDKRDRGDNRRVIIQHELENIIAELGEGTKAFIGQLDLEQAQKPQMITNTGKKAPDVLGAHKDWEKAEYDLHKSDKRYSEGFVAGMRAEGNRKVQQSTREELEQYSQSRESYFNAVRGSRLYRCVQQCLPRCNLHN